MVRLPDLFSHLLFLNLINFTKFTRFTKISKFTNFTVRLIFKYLWVVTLRLFFSCDFKISVAALGVASVQEGSNRAIQKKDVPRISLMAAATVPGTSLYLLIFNQ